MELAKDLGCGGCSTPYSKMGHEPGAGPQIYSCPGCGGLVGTCYLGESYALVHGDMDPDPNPPSTRYYDLLCLGSEGMRRRHGWFNPVSRKIVQVG